MKIYVGNLPFRAEEIDLMDLFKQYGEVESVAIVVDQKSRKSKGFGFVYMNDDTDAQNAINCLDSLNFMERELIVNEAVTREFTEQKKRRNEKFGSEASKKEYSRVKTKTNEKRNKNSKSGSKKLSKIERKSKSKRGAGRNEQDPQSAKKKKLKGKRKL